MASVDVLPDAVLVTHDFLIADAATAALVVDRISSQLSPTPVFPCLTVQRIGGIPSIRQRLDSPRLQIAGWGETEAEASLVARTARAALHRMVNYRHASAVVTGVIDDQGLAWLPDTLRTPPTPRWIFGVVAHLHIP